MHKAWFFLVIAVLNTLVCLGFGRFSLAAIIPFMKDGLLLNYSQTGLIVSSVFFGYLVTATFSGYFIARFTTKKVIIFSLGMIVVGMVGSAFAQSFWMAYGSCLLIGLGTGGSNMATIAVVGNWFAADQRGMAFGVINAGPGLGIVLSGFLVPVFISFNPVDGWRTVWIVLSLTVGFMAIMNILFMKNRPEDINLEPYSRIKQKEGENEKTPSEVRQSYDSTPVHRNKKIWFIGLIYFTFGFSYLIFSTFFVDYLMTDAQFSKEDAGQFFAMAGALSIVSGYIGGVASDRFGRFPTLIFLFLLQTTLLIGFSLLQHTGLVLVITVLYGMSLLGIPTVLLASVGDIVHPLKRSAGIGFITLFFGIGQLVSPIVTGYLIDLTSSYFFAFLLAAFICLLGGLGSISFYLSQRKQKLVVDAVDQSTLNH